MIDSYAESRANHERFNALVKHFEKNPPQSEAPIAPPPNDSWRYSHQIDAEHAERGRIAEFDAEQRAAGRQIDGVPGDAAPDQRALDFLTQWRSNHPEATTQDKATWERDYAQVLEGRRFGETAQQWEARKNGAAAAPSSLPEADTGADFAAPADIKAEQLHGYSLPELPPGVDVHVSTLTSHLAAARAAGIPEAQVHAVMRALAAQAAA